MITYDSNNKDSSGIINPTINYLGTSVSSSGLVGELKTPSLPSSVDITPITPSQSLISSKDEFCKEIEDVSISPLYSFEGVIDLPYLSFHSSLEENLDEEEEPEELQSVKAEKLPPHHSCDHHIELEGSLPPVGVLQSLSNKTSEKLWAHISENVEKAFVKPSSYSTGAPVLFVKTKDGGLCLCVDYCKTNASTKKNRYPVAPMRQILTAFNDSTIFPKIEFHGAYTHLRIKDEDANLTAFREKYGSYE
ncbi:hypothetical protein O181_033323 [Austropuccinia psidii MF-1]|uniref:Reverse transcriptase domain-containing protein n=1 Tax=Austropuccinia psidii MF-1 TaxID=1389203 RepID=A0A9Q3D1A7_9BASI|nr:hypothetical protein [Austropuccinia psidii MF-1]